MFTNSITSCLIENNPHILILNKIVILQTKLSKTFPKIQTQVRKSPKTLIPNRVFGTHVKHDAIKGRVRVCTLQLPSH